jgi:hypothetical protein
MSLRTDWAALLTGQQQLLIAHARRDARRPSQRTNCTDTPKCLLRVISAVLSQRLALHLWPRARAHEYIHQHPGGRSWMGNTWA